MDNLDIEDKVVKKSIHYKFISLGIAVLIILVLFFVVFYNSGGNNNVAAKVNGEKIFLSDLESIYSSLPQDQQLTINKSEILNGLVQSKVLFLKAKSNDYSISEVEAQSEIDNLLVSSGVTKEQLLQNLQTQGISETDFMDKYIEQLTVQKYIDNEIISKIIISDNEIKDYYSDNINVFLKDEQVTVKHILIGDEDLDANGRGKKAKQLLDKITPSNFCDYVNKYSTDKASVPGCGEYVFGKQDPYVEEFKTLSFSQNIGDIGVVDTQFGSHIIWTVGKTAPGYAPFNEVSDQIEEFLKNQKATEQFKTYYENLKDSYNIKVYSLEL